MTRFLHHMTNNFRPVSRSDKNEDFLEVIKTLSKDEKLEVMNFIQSKPSSDEIKSFIQKIKNR